MFGYLKVYKPELLVKDADTYKSVYCTLCKTLGKDYSPLSRLLLNYDHTFYTLISIALQSECQNTFSKKRCCCNIFKTCTYCSDNEFIHKSAGFTIITAYHKLSDDIQDSKLFKSLFIRFFRLLFKGSYKKAKNKYPVIDLIVSNVMYEQAKIENEILCGDTHNFYEILDNCTSPSATMLSELLQDISDDEFNKRALSELGYQLGTWIYLLDAVDDLQKDIKHNNFNCLKYFDKSKNLDNECKIFLNLALAKAFSAFKLLDIYRFKGILDNYFVYGLKSVQDNILNKKQKGNKNEESL